MHDRAVRARAADRVEADVVQRVGGAAEAFERADHVDFGQRALRGGRRRASRGIRPSPRRRADAPRAWPRSRPRSCGPWAGGRDRRPRRSAMPAASSRSRSASGARWRGPAGPGRSARRGAGRKASGGARVTPSTQMRRGSRRRTWPGRRRGSRVASSCRMAKPCRTGLSRHIGPADVQQPAEAVGQGEDGGALARRAQSRAASRARLSSAGFAGKVDRMGKGAAPGRRRAGRARSHRPDWLSTGRSVTAVPSSASVSFAISSSVCSQGSKPIDASGQMVRDPVARLGLGPGHGREVRQGRPATSPACGSARR